MQIGIRAHGLLHGLLVQIPIHLCPRSAHRRPLAPIQYTVVNPRLVRRRCHDALQSVNLAHQLSLANVADGGIARELAHRVEALRTYP